MTDNHLLLYRLAELMLEHEQNVLPVDLLFDDEQIGDFVKSIQIDSPYQQMLFEGVLTESVREEKLYVSFTIEGYFHHVLGEVVENKSKDKSALFLYDFLQRYNFPGIFWGVQNCLIRDVEKGVTKRLMELIDLDVESLNMCVTPLAKLFGTYIELDNSKSKEENMQMRITSVLTELFANTSENDINLLEMTIEKLELNQKNEICRLIYRELNQKLQNTEYKSSKIFVKSIKFSDKEIRQKQLNDLLKIKPNHKMLSNSLFYLELAHQLYENADIENAILNYNKSEEILIKIKEDISAIILDLNNKLGITFQIKGDNDKALFYFNKCISIYQNSVSNDDSFLARIYNNIGTTYWRLRDFDNSLKFMEQSLYISLKVNGKNHPSSAHALVNIGLIWSSQGNYNRAIKNYEEALKIRLNTFGDKDIDITLIYNNLGVAWKKNNDFDKALGFYKKCLEIRLEILGFFHPSTGAALNNLGVFYEEINDFELAIKHYKKALKVNTSIFGETHFLTELYYSNISDVMRKKGDIISAIKSLKKCLKIKFKLKGEFHFDLAVISKDIGDLLLENNDRINAAKYYTKAVLIYSKSNSKDEDFIKELNEKLTTLNDL
jgi:tetratricopeptide (TPR) repeat protein